MKTRLSIFIMICFLFSGCATRNIIQDSVRAVMYLMIYDYENKGLQDVEVFINGKSIGKTDVYGRYLLSLKENESYTIQLRKNKYETITRDFVFDPLCVLYFQMGNAAQFLCIAEDAMDNAEYRNAIAVLDRTINLDDKRIDALYLKVIAYHKMNLRDEALSLLQTLEPLVKDPYLIGALKQKIVSAKETLGEIISETIDETLSEISGGAYE